MGNRDGKFNIPCNVDVVVEEAFACTPTEEVDTFTCMTKIQSSSRGKIGCEVLKG